VPPTSSRHPLDYEPVAPLSPRLGGRGGDEDGDEANAVRPSRAVGWGEDGGTTAARERVSVRKSGGKKATEARAASESARLRPGHGFTFAGLFLFTFYLFYRPYEFLPLPMTLAFWLALLTLAVYVPSQLSTEGNLTARPREVNLVLLLTLTGLLSIPLAKGSAGEAWATFTDIFIRAVLIFIVIVNAVRTERRLRWMLLLSLGSAVVLAVGALNDFRTGRLTVEGYRVEGRIGGIFENPNDMALHLVTMMPVAVALAFGSRGLSRKLLYGGAALLMAAATVVTYSRGGFLSMTAAMLVLGWALGRRHRFAVVTGACVLALALLVLAPGGYGMRIFSIYDHNLDALGSANARQALLLRSIVVAVRNPLFGVGMGNFSYVSFRNQVTHNAYTQVAAEMGAAAFVLYLLYIVTPLRHLRAIARETFEARRTSRFYYLAVGLAASLVGYMVASFFGSVAYYWNVYYLVGYAVCLRRLYEASLAEPAAARRVALGAEDGVAVGDGVDEEGREGLAESGELTGRALSL
jgi:putative inorganic carbon (HCO3(-)) transporter